MASDLANITMTTIITTTLLFPRLQGDSIAGLGYRLELDGMTMKGKVDTHGIISAVIEKRLDPMPAQLMLSGQLNHWTDESRFGIAIMVG